MKKILPLLLLALMISSCGSKIAGGLAKNSGNMLLGSEEGKKKGTGGYLEYGYQKMFDRHGVGVDLTFNTKGYLTKCIECYEGTDMLYHTVQAKYYYTLIERGADSFRLDLSFGFGFGKFTLNGRDRYYPTVVSLGLDFYLTKNELIYISQRVKYLNHLKSDEFNLGLELGVGFYFKGDDGYDHYK